MRKKAFLLIVVLIGILSIPFVYADFDSENNTTLEDSIEQSLGNLDFTGLNEITSNLDSNTKELFSSSTFLDKVRSFLNGENVDYTSFLSSVFHTFFDEALNFLPVLISIIVLAVLCSIISSLRGSVGESSIEKIVNFVCFSVISVILFNSVTSIFNNVSSCVSSIKGQMDAVFPILLTLIASVGGVNSVGIFQPMLAIFSNLIVQVFTVFLMPLFWILVVFCLISHISDIKLDKFNLLFMNMFKWGARGGFLLASGTILVGGIMAGSLDGASIKATRFALKSYVPVLGGYLSDGVNLVAVSGVLIKNAVGVCGIVLSVSTIALPLVSVIVFSLGLKLSSSVLQLTQNSAVSDFLSDLSKVVDLLITVLVGVGFMYVVSLGMLVSTANIF